MAAEDLEVAIVIPLFNGAETITEQLDALARQTFSRPFEVVVADNGSTDAGPGLVRAHPMANLRLVDASQCRGQAHARHVGARGTPLRDRVTQQVGTRVAASRGSCGHRDAVAIHAGIKPRNPPHRARDSRWLEA